MIKYRGTSCGHAARTVIFIGQKTDCDVHRFSDSVDFYVEVLPSVTAEKLMRDKETIKLR